MFCTLCECFSKTAPACFVTCGKLKFDLKRRRVAGKVLSYSEMVIAAPPVPGNDSAVSPNRMYSTLVKVFVFSAIVIFIYGRILTALAIDWWTIPSQSQGLLIPPLALYIAWEKRHKTLAAPVAPDYRGLLIVASACVLLLLGKIGAEFFLMRSSFVVLLIGTVVTFWGWRRARTLALPFLLLATMVPLPAFFYNSATTPLQLLASRIATEIAQVFGVTVYRDGNVIHLANISLGVEEACSGLNSLTALSVGGILLGYLTCTRNVTRLLVMLLSVPIAIAMNVLRVAGTAVIADYYQDIAMGFYHAFSGWLVFLLGFGTLYLSAKLLHHSVDPLVRRMAQ